MYAVLEKKGNHMRVLQCSETGGALPPRGAHQKRPPVPLHRMPVAAVHCMRKGQTGTQSEKQCRRPADLSLRHVQTDNKGDTPALLESSREEAARRPEQVRTARCQAAGIQAASQLLHLGDLAANTCRTRADSSVALALWMTHACPE